MIDGGNGNWWDELRNPDIAASREFADPPASGSYATVSRGQSAGPQLPPRGTVPSESPFVRVQFPPRLEKLAESTDFRQQNYQLVLPAAPGTVAGPTFRLPQDFVGWLQNNAIYVLTPVAATDFSMAIFINDGPVPGYDDIRIPPGLANFVLTGDDDMRIRVPNGATITTLFTNRRAAAEVVGGLIQGWFHPLSSEERAWGSGG